MRNKTLECCTACRKFVKHAVTANATQNSDPESLNINKKKSKSVPSLSPRECALSSELLYRAVIIHRKRSEEDTRTHYAHVTTFDLFDVTSDRWLKSLYIYRHRSSKVQIGNSNKTSIKWMEQEQSFLKRTQHVIKQRHKKLWENLLENFSFLNSSATREKWEIIRTSEAGTEEEKDESGEGGGEW